MLEKKKQRAEFVLRRNLTGGITHRDGVEAQAVQVPWRRAYSQEHLSESSESSFYTDEEEDGHVYAAGPRVVKVTDSESEFD